jgi:hypothetical protein
MEEILVSVFGATTADAPALERELSEIFGAPAESDMTLSGLPTAAAFLVTLAKTNLQEIAKQLVALVRRAVGMRIELDVSGIKLMVDGLTSPEQIVPLLQQLAELQHDKRSPARRA